MGLKEGSPSGGWRPPVPRSLALVSSALTVSRAGDWHSQLRAQAW